MSAVVETLAPISETWTYFNDVWAPGNVAIMGPRTHGAWLGTTVFDGARWFEGVAPDLAAHCARVNRSAVSMGLKPVVDETRWEALVHEGAAKFPADAALYVRPMYWAEAGGAGGGVRADPESTRWCLCLYEAPMPPINGPAITLSPYRKPTPEVAPIEAKAGCLYPNNGRALMEAGDRGFGNALMRDANGNIAELANAKVGACDFVPNGMDLEQATRVMLHVHQKGVGVCGIFPYEIAETKVNQVMDFARQTQHPLQCTLEKA